MAISDEDIEAAAASPLEVESDGQKVKQQSLKDLLDARDRIDSGTAASASPRRGIRFTKLIPPGTA